MRTRRRRSPISWSIPTSIPELAEKYKVTVMNTTHIQYGDDEKGSGSNVTELTEEALTNAIIRVTKSD